MYYPPYQRTNKPKASLIKVIGEGKVSVRPDQADIKLGVVTENEQLTKALEENSRIINNIKKALRDLGIEEEQIQTFNYSIFPQYDFIDGKQVFRGYRVEHMLEITVKDIETAGTVVDRAVQQGANQITGITFTTSRYQQHYQQALSKAVINASEKAKTIAKTIGVQASGPPKSVTEIKPVSGGPIPYQMSAMVKSEADTSFEPGILEIESLVEVEFTFH